MEDLKWINPNDRRQKGNKGPTFNPVARAPIKKPESKKASSSFEREKESTRLMTRRDLQKISRLFLIWISSYLAADMGVKGLKQHHDTESNRFKVETSIDKMGEKAFAHEDLRTTQIIDMLTGKRALTSQERTILLKTYKEISQIDLRRPEGFDRELYLALWTLEQDFNNPKIKFMHEDVSCFATFPVRRSHFHTDANEIHLFPNATKGTASIDDYFLDDLISEFAHSEQFSKDPFSAGMITSIQDWGLSLGQAFSSKERHEIYDQFLYDIPGSLEYEAHNLIEPNIRSKFSMLVPKRHAMQKALQDASTELQVIREEFDKLHEKALVNDPAQALALEHKLQREQQEVLGRLQIKFKAIKDLYDK